VSNKLMTDVEKDPARLWWLTANEGSIHLRTNSGPFNNTTVLAILPAGCALLYPLSRNSVNTPDQKPDLRIEEDGFLRVERAGRAREVTLTPKAFFRKPRMGWLCQVSSEMIKWDLIPEQMESVQVLRDGNPHEEDDGSLHITNGLKEPHLSQTLYTAWTAMLFPRWREYIGCTFFRPGCEPESEKEPAQ